MGHMVGYFVYNGDTYSAGTVIRFKKGYYNLPSWEEEQEVIFLGYNTKADLYTIGKKGYELKYTLPREKFYDGIIAVTDKIERDESCVQYARKFNESYDRNSKLISTEEWWTYIVAMITSVIFSDCIGLMVFFTYVLFDCRNERLKKRGGR